MISIVIPTYNNLDYLKLCLDSIEKNSSQNHDVRLHINDGSDGTLEFAKKNKIFYTFSNNNIGLCSSINKISSTVKNKYLLYAHDDMYFCPNWDNILLNELKIIKHNLFYLSGTMIEKNSAHISFDCGNDISNFDENKLLLNYSNLKYYDHQGSHFAPHLVPKDLWDKVGGFSEEFNPGMASDPDFNMKLWNEGVRIFKGLSLFRVYHFSSTTTRKKNSLKRNKGNITFLKKWGFTHKFFKKHYLRSRSKYKAPLENPLKNFSYYLDLSICKVKLFYLKIFFKF
jgi:glycosyltransferase involved in cell wall biosynthesis